MINKSQKIKLLIILLISVISGVGIYFAIKTDFLGKLDSSASQTTTLSLEGFELKAYVSKSNNAVLNYTIEGLLPACTKHEVSVPAKDKTTITLRIIKTSCTKTNQEPKEFDISNTTTVRGTSNELVFEVLNVSDITKKTSAQIDYDDLKLNTKFSGSSSKGTWNYTIKGQKPLCYVYSNATFDDNGVFTGTYTVVFAKIEGSSDCAKKQNVNISDKLTSKYTSAIATRLRTKYVTRGELVTSETIRNGKNPKGNNTQIWYLTSAKATYDSKLPSDYLEAFTNPSKWKESIKYIDVYFFSTAGRSSKMFEAAFLKSNVVPLFNKNGIKIGLNSGTATWFSCRNKAQQDYLVSYDLEHIKRVKNAGSEVSYIRLESVLGKPVPDKFKAGCPNYTQEQRINDAVIYIRRIKNKYPEIKIGVVDATASLIAKNSDNSKEGYEEVFTSLVSKLNASEIDLDHIIIDTGTEISSGKRSPGLLEYNRLLKLENYIQEKLDVNAGIIVTSYDGGEVSDKVYYDEVMNFYTQYSKIGGNPDFYMLESWHKYPTKLLPDTNAKDYTMMKGVLDFSKKVKGNL